MVRNQIKNQPQQTLNEVVPQQEVSLLCCITFKYIVLILFLDLQYRGVIG